MELRKGRVNKSPYKHTNYAGLYIGIFIYEKRISISKAASESNIEGHIFRMIIEGKYKLGMKTFFKVADFMASKSSYSVGHFMTRLKQEMDKGALNESK